MNWLTNFVRPKLRELVRGQKDIPDNLWRKCPGCEKMIFHRDLEKNLSVCQHCGHHMRIGAGPAPGDAVRRRRLRDLGDGFRTRRSPESSATRRNTPTA